MTDFAPRHVPVGPRSHRWATVRSDRQVLIVVHNTVSMTRLLDLLPVFETDFRVQVVCTVEPSDPFRFGLEQFLTELGLCVLPWQQAVLSRFDLVIAANHGGLGQLNGPLMILPHGIGYTKYSPSGAGSREPGAGSREPGAGSREPGAGSREPFGLSAQWLLYDGRPVADAVILSHQHQRDDLARSAPQVLPVAVVAGDPCYDRLLASRADRARYRAALGVPDGRRVVLVNSTWSNTSLFGRWPTLLRRILAELPIDEYAVVAVLHPNVWDGHGPWQIRSWLADCLRSGLVLIPPTEGWRAALVAADCVIGDHGSVTAYGAALGKATLLAAFPTDEVVPNSVADALGAAAPRLDARRPLRAQIDAAVAGHTADRYAGVTALASSAPGSALRLLTQTCYRLLDLPEPDRPVTAAVLPSTGLSRASASASHVDGVVEDEDAPRVTVTRYPAAVQPAAAAPPAGHLAVHERHPDPRLRAAADVLLIDGAPGDRRLPEILASQTGIRLAGALGPGADCVLLDRFAGRLTVHGPVGHDPALSASALYAWLLAHRRPPDTLVVRTGAVDRLLTVTREPA